MFGPWLETWEWIKGYLWPTQILRKRRLNFITIHYLYIMGMSLVASIIVFICGGGIAYIDALFLAAGAVTQSGLNPVNINDLNTGQQIVFYLFPMVCTPVFINTFVVFVRLFWFERRFQNIVNDARNFRHTRSRSKTETQEAPDLGNAEKGVRGRSIVVLHHGNKPGNGADHEMTKDKTHFLEEEGSASSSSQGAKYADPADQATYNNIVTTPTFHRDIVFADEIKDHEKPPMLPQQMNSEQHIAFLENQRNPKDASALRIPGPKDYDRGYEPKPLGEDDDGGDIIHLESSCAETSGATAGVFLRKRNVTIDEPDHPRLKIETSPPIAKHLTRQRAGINPELTGLTPVDEQQPSSSRFAKARTGTFSSLKNWASAENEDVTPYLSWQPTIGRNSAFVDLTEEQREELGGIEYRSLKTLAVVLVRMSLLKSLDKVLLADLTPNLVYYCLFHILGLIIFLPWIVLSDTWGPIVDADGQSRVWWYDRSLTGVDAID